MSARVGMILVMIFVMIVGCVFLALASTRVFRRVRVEMKTFKLRHEVN